MNRIKRENKMKRFIARSARTVVLGAVLVVTSFAGAATNELTEALQRGLFEEEANHNLEAAIQAYQSAAARFDQDRRLAATAIFRMGECYRKQGNTNAANAQFERVLREFADQTSLATLSRQNLTAPGGPGWAGVTPPISLAARQEQKRLIEEEIKLVEKKLAIQENKVKSGVEPSDALLATQQEILGLRRQLAALDVPQSAPEGASPPAAPTADLEEIKRIRGLIQDSPDLINAPDKNDQTLLQIAAAKGRLAVVKLLLDNGAALEGLKQPDLTALHYAAANGHKAVVDLLLQRGANAGAQNGQGVTPLHMAVFQGYEAVAASLLAARAPVNARVTAKVEAKPEKDLPFYCSVGQTPLHLAAQRGYSGCVSLLIKNGADVNAEDASGRTSLSYAAQRKFRAVVKDLLAARANPDAGKQDLPLNVAVYNGDIPLVEMLLTNGAEPNTETAVSWSVSTPRLHFSSGIRSLPLAVAVLNHRPEVVTLLLRAKANPNGTDPSGSSLILSALDDPPTLKALLENGTDPNESRSGPDSAPLLLALAGNRTPAVELLLSHGANAKVADGSRNTGLHIAAREGSLTNVSLLLKSGVEVDARNKNGQTPLHLAVQKGNAEIVALLLQSKADPNARDENGRTPLELTSMPDQFRPGVPLGYQWQGPPPPRVLPVPSSPPALPPPPTPVGVARPAVPLASSPATNSGPTIPELLRQHGALDQLPDFTSIRFTRQGAGSPVVVFKSDTNAVNRFTLLQAIAAFFSADNPGTIPGYAQFRFPDYSRIRIRRPVEGKPGETQEIAVNLYAPTNAPDRSTNAPPPPNTPSFQQRLDQILSAAPEPASNLLDPAKDQPLCFGDVIEIPERVHTLSEAGIALTKNQGKELTKHLQIKVQLKVRGQTSELLLSGFRWDTRLSSALQATAAQSILSSSSDFSRVRVLRPSPNGGSPTEFIRDVRPFWNNQSSDWEDLWLRDGDVIEVPEKN